MKLLEGRNALVTGGGRGIGREVALDLAISGANVAVSARSKEELNDTVKEIEKFGVKGVAIPADLSTLKGVSECATKFFNNFDSIDILINNAGMTHDSSVIDNPIENVQKLFNLNIMGYYALIREVLPKMIEKKSGNIVMTSSIQGNVFFSPKMVAYVTSKAAVSAMGRSMSAELRQFNINVNVITPAGVETKMAEDLREWGHQMPITVPPEYISPAYLFLASDLALKKYKGRVLEIHTIVDMLPKLQMAIGEKDLELKELTKLAEETFKKNSFRIFRKNSELIHFMLKFKR